MSRRRRRRQNNWYGEDESKLDRYQDRPAQVLREVRLAFRRWTAWLYLSNADCGLRRRCMHGGRVLRRGRPAPRDDGEPSRRGRAGDLRSPTRHAGRVALHVASHLAPSGVRRHAAQPPAEQNPQVWSIERELVLAAPARVLCLNNWLHARNSQRARRAFKTHALGSRLDDCVTAQASLPKQVRLEARVSWPGQRREVQQIPSRARGPGCAIGFRREHAYVPSNTRVLERLCTCVRSQTSAVLLRCTSS